MIVVANDLAIYNVYNYDIMYKKRKKKINCFKQLFGENYKQGGSILL